MASEELEQLWPNFTPEQAESAPKVLAIALAVNEKFRERVPAWDVFTEKPDHFKHFFRKVLQLALDGSVSMKEETAILTFLINCFNSVEVDLVRQQFSPLVSLPIWSCLLNSQREHLLSKNTKLRKYWIKIEVKVAQMPEEEQKNFAFDRSFLWNLITRFKTVLGDVDDPQKEVEISSVQYCERFIALMIDLESLLATRRFFNALLHASHLMTFCTLSNLIKSEVGSLFCQLVTMLKSYIRFEIDDITGQPLTSAEMASQHCTHIADLQKAAFKHFRDSMQDFYLLNVASVDTRKTLLGVLNNMSEEDIYKFAEYLKIVAAEDENSDSPLPDKDYLIEAIIFHCERRANQLQQLNEMPLYPTERVIWDENLIPYDRYKGEGVLALNKLNLQFLTLHDYLMRNFNLFQMESTYEIRQDIEDALFRMKPWKHESEPKEVVWGGWAKMALRLHSMQITKVGAPRLGEKSPSDVVANFSIQLPRRADLRKEWESLKKHDVCFLVSCQATKGYGSQFDIRKSFKDQCTISAIRGCEIEGLLDQNGRIIEEFSQNEHPPFDSDVRTYRVRLDTHQYRLDMDRRLETGEEDVYYTFNLVVRRDPKSNNFKAVLQTIRQLLNTDCVVPDWLHELILGHGEPNSAHYTTMHNVQPEVNFNDTFLDYAHLVESFPDTKIVASELEEKMVPPFKLIFKDMEPQHEKNPEERDVSIHVEPYEIPKRGPYVENEPKKNAVRFTPTQIEAIKAGSQPGLTMVVGPPGTGKTDVAVQIISNIYHNWPEQRTLIVTHSNMALNQLFEKIMALDVDERHLLRLGHGEESLETEKDFSRYGRVNYVLSKRLELLAKVEKLKDALEISGDVGYSCETAGHFYRFSVCHAWEKFQTAISKDASNETLIAKFPFTKFFDDISVLFSPDFTFEENKKVTESCWRYISNIFLELEEFGAFEMLRNGKDRTEYLLVKEAKIIAMTCTLAALRRKDLVELGFRYDNILMEEAGQILEVETFIPLLLQNPKDGRSRLKRWIMIGDHNQLPPIVQNVACQKYSNLEQSLFARFIRLGVPHVQLDKQGRARKEIANLYNWRYKQLGNLPHVLEMPEFTSCNAGFVYPYQFIDVPDFQGLGESCPSPYFYQNLGEAEYAVALFTYMRILGYPAKSISIITSYNGQTSLINDVVKRRCADNPLIGRPHKISTVDKYQGQQNDFVILSLVRTQHVGHIRDARRLIVALSRARLGLFVLGRMSLYEKCLELKPAMEKLKLNPTKLHIVPNEPFPTLRKPSDNVESMVIENTEHISMFVHEFYKSNVVHMQAAYEEHMREYYDKVKLLEAEADVMETDESKDTEAVAVETMEAAAETKAKKKDDGEAILFEQMDFEKLEEVPKY